MTARFANGAVSACIVAFFLVHAALGTASLLTGFASPIAWAVWVGVGLIVAHVALSAVTSHQQLTDAERPASPRKKRHLALKWATGALLAVIACLHVVGLPDWLVEALPAHAALPLVFTALLAALALHVCVGAKSLLKDVGIDRRWKNALRIAVCAVAAACCCGIWVAFA